MVYDEDNGAKQFAPGLSETKRNTSEPYSASARALMAIHLPNVPPTALEKIKEDAVNALPLVYQGQTVVKALPDEATAKLTSFEHSLEYRGVDDGMIKQLSAKLKEISDEALKEHGPQKSLG